MSSGLQPAAAESSSVAAARQTLVKAAWVTRSDENYIVVECEADLLRNKSDKALCLTAKTERLADEEGSSGTITFWGPATVYNTGQEDQSDLRRLRLHRVPEATQKQVFREFRDTVRVGDEPNSQPMNYNYRVAKGSSKGQLGQAVRECVYLDQVHTLSDFSIQDAEVLCVTQSKFAVKVNTCLLAGYSHFGYGVCNTADNLAVSDCNQYLFINASGPRTGQLIAAWPTSSGWFLTKLKAAYKLSRQCGLSIMDKWAMAPVAAAQSGGDGDGAGQAGSESRQGGPEAGDTGLHDVDLDRHEPGVPPPRGNADQTTDACGQTAHVPGADLITQDEVHSDQGGHENKASLGREVVLAERQGLANSECQRFDSASITREQGNALVDNIDAVSSIQAARGLEVHVFRGIAPQSVEPSVAAGGVAAPSLPATAAEAAADQPRSQQPSGLVSVAGGPTVTAKVSAKLAAARAGVHAGVLADNSQASSLSAAVLGVVKQELGALPSAAQLPYWQLADKRYDAAELQQLTVHFLVPYVAKRGRPLRSGAMRGVPQPGAKSSRIEQHYPLLAPAIMQLQAALVAESRTNNEAGCSTAAAGKKRKAAVALATETPAAVRLLRVLRCLQLWEQRQAADPAMPTMLQRMVLQAGGGATADDDVIECIDLTDSDAADQEQEQLQQFLSQQCDVMLVKEVAAPDGATFSKRFKAEHVL